MIAIRKIRVMNFKSIKYLEFIVVEEKTVFVGQNNAGKSNILKAIDIAFNFRYQPTEYDIYSKKEPDEECCIDIMIASVDVDKNFSVDWLTIFGDKIIKNEFNEDSFTLRCVIKQNDTSKRVEIERFPILDWNSNEYSSTNKSIPREIRKCISTFYLNSNRDIVDELRVKNSNFSKLMKNSNFELSIQDSISIEKGLNIINKMIRRKMPSILEIENQLSDISTTVQNVKNLKIIPIPNRFDDLDKGVEIQVNNDNLELPINVFGDGTRSWISILSLSVYIESVKKQMFREGLPFFPIILLEEPESHLHPQAQNKIVVQLDRIDSQIFLTTHSNSIVSELNMFQVLRVCNDESTKIITLRNKLTVEDQFKIINFILPFYSDILFSENVILVEGVSDKLIINEYIKLKIGKKPFELGINIVAVNGKDNLPLFRLFCELHGIDNTIYADLDAKADLEQVINDRGLRKDKILYTTKIDMEEELIEEQFEFCKKIYIKYNNCSVEYINSLIQRNVLKEKMLKYLKDNKTQYPHWMSNTIDVKFKIHSLDNLISLVGGKK